MEVGMSVLQEAEEASRPLNEPTYVRVKRKIISELLTHRIIPNERLTIEMLTSRYGVSHMPVREAMRSLEGEGILKSLAHRGFRVEAITDSYIQNIYDIRVGVESMLARRAAERVTTGQVEALTAIEDHYESLVLQDRATEAVKANVAFHAFLYAIAENKEAEQLLEGRTRLVRTVADSLDTYSPLDRRQIFPEHRSILKALGARDPMKCGQAVFDHVTNARDRLLMRIRETAIRE